MPELTFDLKYGYLNGEIPAECVTDCSHQGRCDEDVEYWVRRLHFAEALEPVRDLAVRYLREYGAWDDLETADLDALAQRILWTACCDIHENHEPWLGLVD